MLFSIQTHERLIKALDESKQEVKQAALQLLQMQEKCHEQHKLILQAGAVIEQQNALISMLCQKVQLDYNRSVAHVQTMAQMAGHIENLNEKIAEERKHV
jgi:DNA segregation ATPase FtsK/SpoIIIE-like protein